MLVLVFEFLKVVLGPNINWNSCILELDDF